MKLGSVFDALGDDTRRAILRLLADGERSAGDIADHFHLSKATLSHHFRVLRAANLVRSERRGTSIVYTLQSNVIEDAARVLFDLVPGLALPVRSSKKGRVSS
ncbi:MAG: metalloregulator ArsR/SmtB family transcription factor [Polyangiaceae bacterium]